MSYPENVMRRLRQRDGLRNDDKSHDEKLNELSPIEALREMAAWELGCSDWADTFLDWAGCCGLKITDSGGNEVTE